MDQMGQMLTVAFDALKAAKDSDQNAFALCIDQTFSENEDEGGNELDFKKFKKLISKYRVMEDFTHETLNIDGNDGEMGFKLKTGVLTMKMKAVGTDWKISKILFSFYR